MIPLARSIVRRQRSASRRLQRFTTSKPATFSDDYNLNADVQLPSELVEFSAEAFETTAKTKGKDS